MSPPAALLDPTTTAPVETTKVEIDLFDRQPTPASLLPEPTAVVAQLAQAIVDVLFGRRALAQLNAFATEEVLDQLRVAQCVMVGLPVAQRLGRRTPRISSIRVTSPVPGVVEASAVVASSPRSRALALRLEGLDGRWRCTAVGMG